MRGRVKTILKACVFAALLAAFTFAFENMSAVNDSESEKILSRSVERAVTDCYAIEGMYPPNFKYLEENYGISIDDNKYYVDYQTFGSNIRPVIQIIKRGTLEVEGSGFEE